MPIIDDDEEVEVVSKLRESKNTRNFKGQRERSTYEKPEYNPWLGIVDTSCYLSMKVTNIELFRKFLKILKAGGNIDIDLTEWTEEKEAKIAHLLELEDEGKLEIIYDETIRQRYQLKLEDNFMLIDGFLGEILMIDRYSGAVELSERLTMDELYALYKACEFFGFKLFPVKVHVREERANKDKMLQFLLEQLQGHYNTSDKSGKLMHLKRRKGTR